MKNLAFNFCYLLGLTIAVIIRSVYSRYYKKSKIQGNKTTILDVSLITLSGIGMFIFPFLYIFFSWFNFADYFIPYEVAWIGVAIFIIGIILLWRSHADLGINWTPTLQIRENQTLIVHGTYRYIRHPMYAAHLLWGISQPLLLHNWVAGFSTLMLLIPTFLYRIPHEEKMLLEFFGKKYQSYINQTGRRITFEWALISGVNDTEEVARKLASRLKGLMCHVNAIPLNPTTGYEGRGTDRQRAAKFKGTLEQAGIPCTIRMRRGIEIQAGCGQLAGSVDI